MDPIPAPPPLPNQFDRGSYWPLAILCASILALAVAAYAYAIPLASRLILSAVPLGVDQAIGDVFFQSMDGSVLAPTRLAAGDQARLRAAFSEALAKADNDAIWPTTLEFRSGEMGPNAFALPGGRIVVTDELVTLVNGRDDVVLGVLAHEYGHVKARHGVRMVAQSALLRTATGLLLGDFSAILAGAPARSASRPTRATSSAMPTLKACGC